MILRSPTEHENEGTSLHRVLCLVIPAHAGIQVCSPRRISLDTRFRGYDGTQAASSFCGSSPYTHFQRSHEEHEVYKISEPFVVRKSFVECGSIDHRVYVYGAKKEVDGRSSP